MVLVGNRSAEESENSITGGLRYIAAIAVDRIHHQPERRITMARASSGSRSSISSIEPLMSANSAVTVLRSPSSAESGISALGLVAGLVESSMRRDGPAMSSGSAHSRQNFAFAGFSALHEGHRGENRDAHSTQNFARWGFSAPHFEHRIA